MNCNCIDETNERLKQLNLRLSGYAYTVPDFKRVFTINTQWIDASLVSKRERKNPIAIWATFCPFCGNPVEKKGEQ